MKESVIMNQINRRPWMTLVAGCALWGLILGRADASVIGYWTFDDNTANDAQSGTTALNDGQWHLVVGTYNTSYRALYVDGVRQWLITGDGSQVATTTAPVLFGGMKDAAGVLQTRFLGRPIDNVAIYNQGLGAAQVARLAAGANPLTIGETAQWGIANTPALSTGWTTTRGYVTNAYVQTGGGLGGAQTALANGTAAVDAAHPTLILTSPKFELTDPNTPLMFKLSGGMAAGSNGVQEYWSNGCRTENTTKSARGVVPTTPTLPHSRLRGAPARRFDAAAARTPWLSPSSNFWS